MPTSWLDAYLEPLLAGDRVACRVLVHERLKQSVDPAKIYFEVLWPAMQEVSRLYQSDRINGAAEHMATRINRSVADQVQLSLPRHPANGKRMVIACADDEPEELGAQMCADLFESRGWDVYFLGGGVPNDEVLSLLGQLRPNMLLLFGTQPSGVPAVRRLIDLIREVGANPTMNIMVSGGVFNRAEDLWKEVNADVFAPSAKDALDMANDVQPRVPQFRPPGAPKKRRRRRPPLLTQAAASS
jgi:methanogenic corrinoid protein MtbC1